MKKRKQDARWADAQDSKVQRRRAAKEGTKPRSEETEFRWNREKGHFVGDVACEKLSQDVYMRWAPEFGHPWIARTWRAIFDWCAVNPEKIAAKKDHRKFVLNWFRRDAAKERERIDTESAVAREARVGERR